MDDWQDEKKITRRAMAATLKKDVAKIAQKYPQKAEIIRQSLADLSKAEQSKETNIDLVSGYFGTIMAQMAAIYDDEWSQVLQRLGYQLGKFIYLLDAFEDLEDDRKAGRYNVLEFHTDHPDFETFCEKVLNAVMSQCAREFELLPIIQDAEILRNIIYSGVWTRFELVRAKRANQQVKK